MFYACVQLPGTVEPSSPLASHVTNRFLERASQETGWSQPVPAILCDYRSFDLFTLSVFFFAIVLLGLLLGLEEDSSCSFRGRAGKAAALGILGSGIGFLLGAYSLWKGYNFLDFDPLASFFKPATARWTGSSLLGLGMAVALTGILLSFPGKPAIRKKEETHDR